MFSSVFFRGALILGLAGMSAAEAMTDCPGTLPANGLTLAVAVDSALCRNVTTRDAWTQIRIQEAGVRLAGSTYKPSATLGLSATDSSSDPGSSSKRIAADARLSYLLWDFGQRAAEQSQARALLAAATASRDAAVSNVSSATVAAYLGVLKASGQITAAKAAEDASSRSQEAAEARFRTGAGTPLDVLQAKAAYAQAVLARVKAENALATAKGALAHALAVSPLKLPELANVDIPVSASVQTESLVEPMIRDALAQRPEIRAAQSSLQASESALDILRSQNRPSVSLNGSLGAGHTSGQNQTTGSVGISLDIPLDINGSNSARLAQGEAQRDSRRIALDQARMDVEQDVWQSFHDAGSAAATVQAAADSADSSRKAATVALGRYQAGLGTLLDVLNAQSSQAAAEQQLIAARYDWLNARTRLALSLGKPFDGRAMTDTAP